MHASTGYTTTGNGEVKRLIVGSCLCRKAGYASLILFPGTGESAPEEEEKRFRQDDA